VIPFTLILETISANFPNQVTLFIGIVFLIIVYFIPRGFAGLLEDLRHWSQTREGLT